MIRLLSAFVLLAIGVNTLNASDPELVCRDISGVASQPGVNFDHDLRLIFQDDLLGCVNCHGSDGGAAADLPLDGPGARNHLVCAPTQGSVPATPGFRVVPGDPMQSWLYLRVACDDPADMSFLMPRNSSFQLTSQELRLIADWIEQGALPADSIFANRFEPVAGC